MTRRSIVIVGGGIAGLAAAWEIASRDDFDSSSTRVEVIEASDRLGAAIATAPFAGRTIDTGADGFLARRPEAAQFAREVGLGDDLVEIAASGAWIYLRGELNPVPVGSALGVPTSAASLAPLTSLSRRAKYCAWRDEHAPRRLSVNDDATIGQIVRLKLGDEIALSVVEPMIGGIQAGRIDGLSAKSVFPALLDAAQRGGSLMKALSGHGPVNPGPSSAAASGPAFYSLRDGVGSLPQVVAAQLRDKGVALTVRNAVTKIRATPGEYRWQVDSDVTTTPADAVIVATPAPVAAQLLGEHDPALGALSRIDSASAAIVTLAVERSALRLPPSGTGILVPLGTPFQSDSLMITAITFLERKWPHLAVTDHAVLRAHVGRIDDERFMALSDDELVARVTNELALLLPGFPPVSEARVDRHVSALPQYRVGHEALVAAAQDAASRLGVALAGSAYDGVGIPASIGSGRSAAKQILRND